jgi:predicted transcriptional regulator of viral defense system
MNENKTAKKPEIIKKAINTLPYFCIDNLLAVENNKNYLKILLSRMAKRGEIISLKKGIYVSREYLDNIEKRGYLNDYLEFLPAVLYSPSYLSLEYILSKHSVLSEASYSFTSMSKSKTKKFANKLGIFDYHHLKDDLFMGFEVIKAGDFLIYKASKSKALFDFLYLRKNILLTNEAIKELRLNLENFNSQEIKELKKYVDLENSKKMEKILKYLFEN